MRTPIRNNAIGAIWCVAPAAISNDRVVWNARSNWELIHRLHKSVVRFERIDAVRNAIKLARCGIGDEKGLGRSVNRREQPGSPNEGGADAANPVRRQCTATVWRGNEYNSLYLGPMIENEYFLKQPARLASQSSLCRTRAKESAPDFVVGIGDHQPANHSAHAVADENNPLLSRKRSFHTIEVTAEEHGRIG